MKPFLPICALACALLAPPAVGAEGEADIVFVGDVMVAEIPGQIIARGVDPFAPFAALLQRHDLRIGNLECVVANGGTAEDKPFTFRADPGVLPVLKRHFDAMSVANNHSGDFGKAAFAEELGLMRKAGLPWFGGGNDASEAHKPLILERNGLRIALLGYVEFKPRSFEAGAHLPGVAWSGEDDQVIEDIAAARRDYHADIVIPYMHWGWEEEPNPSPRLREFARRLGLRLGEVFLPLLDLVLPVDALIVGEPVDQPPRLHFHGTQGRAGIVGELHQRFAHASQSVDRAHVNGQ